MSKKFKDFNIKVYSYFYLHSTTVNYIVLLNLLVYNLSAEDGSVSFLAFCVQMDVTQFLKL